MNNKTKKLVLAGLFVAMGVVLSTFHFQIGVSKVFPIQHMINVLCAVVLGPFYAVGVAFSISVLRNILGMGSLLAFPGSMIGALIAGMIYRRLHNYRLAALGEVMGTGIVGGLIAGPFAAAFMGKEVAALFFVIPFLTSTFFGSLIGLVILEMSTLGQIIMKKRSEIQE